MNGAQTDRLLALYPALAELGADVRDDVLCTQAQSARVDRGAVLFEEHQPCRGFPLVLSGCVRVARGSPGGRSLELYRVTPGELCVVSTSCLFGRHPLTAHGQASEPTDLLLLSPAGFERWCEHEPFRRFVFGIFADRLADLMALAEAVAFQRLDQRLAQALLTRDSPMRITHQQLADELGTVREIVTRLLKRFETAGWVALQRERLEVLDPAALRAAAQPDTGPTTAR